MSTKQGLLTLAAVALLPLTLYLDVTTPPRSVQGITGYFAAVFVALWISLRVILPILIAASVGLLAVGYFILSSEFDTSPQFAANRIIVGCFLLLLGFAVHQARRYQHQLAAANASLESKVDEQVQEIALQRERFHELALAASDSFWRIDREGKVFEVSENSIEAIGVDDFELHNPLEKLMESMDSENQQRVATALKALAPFAALTAMDTREGRIWVEVFGRPVFSQPDSFEGYQGVFRNVTQRIQMESDLRHADAMRSVGQLASGLAHDFNNLLFVINMNLELAAMDAGQDAASFIEQAQEASRRGTHLTSLLMASGRSSTQKAQRQDVNSIVQDVCASLQPTIADNHTLTLELAGKLPNPAVEPVALASALTNLCLNARDSMPDGGPIRIQTSLSADETHVVIAVFDNGIGIPEEVQHRVFDPFYTSKPEGHGTGLGLAMVAKFMEQVEGRIELESSESTGTVIRLLFPI